MPDPSPSDRSKAPSERSKTPSDRFKTEMPQIPGVTVPLPKPTASGRPSIKLVVGLVAVLVVAFLGVRWALRPGRAPAKAVEQAQIDVPPPAPDPRTLVPHATGARPRIAAVEEMAKPWSSKKFFISNSFSGVEVPAILVRLPIGSAAQAGGYWAFSTNAPYGDCKLEYVSDLAKLRNDYGFAAARHPMVGNPCNQTLFDPLKTATLPGTDAIVRGAIVQGSDLRPPLGIELRVHGKDIEAIRTE